MAQPLSYYLIIVIAGSKPQESTSQEPAPDSTVEVVVPSVGSEVVMISVLSITSTVISGEL